MSQLIEIQADIVEKSNGFIVLKTQDTVLRLPSDCVKKIITSENTSGKCAYTVTVSNKAEIVTCEALDTSKNIVRNILPNLPTDRVRNDKADLCYFCICTPQDCDCDCF